MLRTWQPLAFGMVFVGMLGCSLQQSQLTHTRSWNKKDIEGLVEGCGETKTIMTLPNGNILYILGEGSDNATAMPVRSVPGHELAMLSEDGKPAKIVKMYNRNKPSNQGNSQKRIVWVETNESGNILLAGCDGCTTEESRVLAQAGQEGQDQELLSGLLGQ